MADSALAKIATKESRDVKSRISQRIRERAQQDFGAPDSMRRAILSFVTEERYDLALTELQRYVESKNEYPQFRARAERYVGYAIGLVNGIKAKRSLPGVQLLAMAKQQELFESALAHFDDLRATLKKVEQIEAEVRLEDIRSTVWVVKAFVYSAMAILLVGLVLEVSRGVLQSADIVLQSSASDATNWLFDKLGI